MQIPILIERIDGNGYRARGGEPLAVTVEAPTRDEALAKVTAEVHARLISGAEIVSLNLPTSEHPWMKSAGMLRDCPMVDEWIKAMEQYRQQIEDDPTYL